MDILGIILTILFGIISSLLVYREGQEWLKDKFFILTNRVRQFATATKMRIVRFRQLAIDYYFRKISSPVFVRRTVLFLLTCFVTVIAFINSSISWRGFTLTENGLDITLSLLFSILIMWVLNLGFKHFKSLEMFNQLKKELNDLHQQYDLLLVQKQDVKARLQILQRQNNGELLPTHKRVVATPLKRILELANNRLTCCFWDSQSDLIYMGGFDQKLYIYNFQEDRLQEFKVGRSIIRTLLPILELNTLIVGNDEGKILAINTESTQVFEIGFVSDAIYSICRGRAKFSFLVAQRSGQISEWQIRTYTQPNIIGENLRVIHQHEGSAFRVEYNHTNNECVSVGGDGLIKSSHLVSGKVYESKVTDKTLFSLTMCKKKPSMIFCGDSGGSIWLTNSPDKTDFMILKGHSDTVRTMQLSPQCIWLLTGSKDKTVRIWHVESKRVWIVYRLRDYVYEVMFSKDSSKLCIVDGTGTLTILDFEKSIDAISPSMIGESIQKFQ